MYLFFVANNYAVYFSSNLCFYILNILGLKTLIDK